MFFSKSSKSCGQKRTECVKMVDFGANRELPGSSIVS